MAINCVLVLCHFTFLKYEKWIVSLEGTITKKSLVVKIEPVYKELEKGCTAHVEIYTISMFPEYQLTSEDLAVGASSQKKSRSGRDVTSVLGV